MLADVTFDLPNDLIKSQIENQEDVIGRLLACKSLGDRKTHESALLLQKTLNEDSFMVFASPRADALAQA